LTVLFDQALTEYVLLETIIDDHSIVTMPFLKSLKRGVEPWKCSDQLAQKKGILNTVYSINGDEYTGEWLNNKKHGMNI